MSVNSETAVAPEDSIVDIGDMEDLLTPVDGVMAAVIQSHLAHDITAAQRALRTLFQEDISEFNSSASQEVFASKEWNWADVSACMLGNIVWFGSDVFVSGFSGGVLDFGRALPHRLIMNIVTREGADSDNDSAPLSVWAVTPSDAFLLCDTLVRAHSSFEGSTVQVRSFFLGHREEEAGFLVSPAALTALLTQSQGIGKVILAEWDLNTTLCRAIVDAREGLEVDLYECCLTGNCAEVLCHGMQRNRGPTTLLGTDGFDVRLLGTGLQGNTSVRDLSLPPDAGTGEELQSIYQSLSDNLGIVELSLSVNSIDDAALSVLCESLSGHLKLQELDLQLTVSCNETIPMLDGLEPGEDPHLEHARMGMVEVMTPERITRRTEAVVDMLRVNKIIQNIQFSEREWDAKLMADEILPRLALNRFRSRIRAVNRVEGAFLPQLLGRVLPTVRDDPTLVFLVLRGNTDLDWVAQLRTRRLRKRVRYTK